MTFVLIVIIFPFSLKIYSHFYWYKSTKCFHIYAIQIWPHPFPNTSRTPFTTSTLMSSSKWFWPKPDSHTGHLFPTRFQSVESPRNDSPLLIFLQLCFMLFFPYHVSVISVQILDLTHNTYLSVFEIRPRFPLLRRQQFSFSCSLHNSLFYNRFHAEFLMMAAKPPFFVQSQPAFLHRLQVLASFLPFFPSCRSCFPSLHDHRIS